MALSEIFSPKLDGGFAFATIGEGERLLCSVRYELLPDAPAKVLRISFPREDVATRFAQVDEWMAALGRWAFRALHFELGLIGDSFLRDWTGEDFALPLRRAYGLLWPVVREGEIDVEWLPPPSAD